MKDPDLLTEAKKLRIDVKASKGEQLGVLAREGMDQPPPVVEQIKKLFVQ
ncbi:MAG: hypothetical protein ACREQA_08515 [Candidatus Binatia bacterium]